MEIETRFSGEGYLYQQLYEPSAILWSQRIDTGTRIESKH